MKYLLKIPLAILWAAWLVLQGLFWLAVIVLAFVTPFWVVATRGLGKGSGASNSR